jgi:hypothetical protein
MLWMRGYHFVIPKCAAMLMTVRLQLHKQARGTNQFMFLLCSDASLS